MIHIDTSALTPSAKWNTKADELTKKLTDAVTPAERNKIIDKNYHWRACKEDLKKLSYGKCWYSEAREVYSHYHVDHFRPKKKATDDDDIDQGGYWWLSYDWTNYRLCGGIGNQKKGDRFRVRHHKANSQDDPLEDEVFYFLDPTDADDVKLLNFDEEGKAIPANPAEQEWEHIRASETIQWFDLNYGDLKDERKRVWIRTSDRIKRVELLRKAYNQTPTNTSYNDYKAELKEMKRQIAPCVELSSTIRCCLRSSGLTWAVKLLEEPINVQVYCAEYLP